MTTPRIVGHQTPRQKKASVNLALAARMSTKQGRDILTFLLQVMRDGREMTSDRIQASKLLLERGWGRAPIEVHIEVEETITLKSYSLDDLMSMKKAMDELDVIPPKAIEAKILEDDEEDGDDVRQDAD